MLGIYITTLSKALEIWFKGFVTGAAFSLIALATYMVYKEYAKEKIRKKREAKKQETKGRTKRRKK